jgi:hypothetical protein
MRYVSDKSCREIKTHILFSETFFNNHGIYEVVWKDIVGLDRQQQMTIQYGT